MAESPFEFVLVVKEKDLIEALIQAYDKGADDRDMGYCRSEKYAQKVLDGFRKRIL